MSQDTFRSFGIKTALKPTSTKLTSFSGHKLKPIGIVQLPCKIQGNNFDIDFYIVDSSWWFHLPRNRTDSKTV